MAVLLRGRAVSEKDVKEIRRMVKEALDVHREEGTLDSAAAKGLSAYLDDIKSAKLINVSVPFVPDEPADDTPAPSGAPGRTGERPAAAASIDATPRQYEFIRNLLRDRDWSGLAPLLHGTAARVFGGGQVDRRTASDLIDALKKCPWKRSRDLHAAPAPVPAAPRRSEPVGEGFYKLDDLYVKVILNQDGTRTYAKAWDGSSWDYELARSVGAYRKLTPAMKLTPEQASEFGHLYGQCIFKGCRLTHEISIRLGYGPVCAEKHGMPWG